MTKRFTDGEIWSKDWFLDLSLKQKLLLKFLFDNCDCAGVYEISYRTLRNCFNEEITKDDFMNLKQIVFINENTVYIQDFIKFQYGCEVSELNPNYSVHKGIIKKLNKYGILETLSKGLDNSYNVTLQDKDKDKDKDIYSTNNRVVELDSKTDTLIEKEKENKKEKESFAVNVWFGEYANVHLKPIQYANLVQYVGKKEVADGLIEDLSANIAQKKENAPPYDDNFPDMHLVKLKTYWKYRKLNGNKPPDKEDKAAKIKNELDELTKKYRLKECESG